jgi:hypothetical protein
MAFTADGSPPAREPDSSTEIPDARGRVQEEALTALTDLLYSQRETLRLARQWSRYEGEIDSAARLAAESLKDADDAAGIEEALKIVNATKGLSRDQRSQAMRRALDLALDEDEKPVGRASSVFRNARLRHRDLGLLSAQLVTLVADFELFVMRIMSAWIEYDSSLLAGRKKEITFADLEAAASLDEMRGSMVQSYLDDHMRKSATAWFKVFCEAFGTEKLEGAEDFATREAFQRRHVIVHHGGVVSHEYLSQLKDYQHQAAIGEHLPVDIGYIESAADALAIVAHSATLAAMFSAAKGSKDAQHYAEREAGELTFMLLNQDRDRVVRRFGQVFRVEQVKFEFAREQMRVNSWIARRRLGDGGAVVQEVEEWDVGAKDGNFKLARAALLGDVSTAAVYARALIESEDLSELTISRWPLFEEIRQELLAALKGQDPTTAATSEAEEDAEGPPATSAASALGGEDAEHK